MQPPPEQATTRTAQDLSYPYANVRQSYRSEKLLISEREHQQLQNWLANDTPQQQIPPPIGKKRRKIILDTDLGTDVDDALALLMLLHLPTEDFEFIGITTVYGYTHVRGAVTEAIVRAWEKQRKLSTKLPILVGESTPIGTHRPVWHTGTEGLGVLSDEVIEALEKKSDFVVANGLPLIPLSNPTQEQGRHSAARWIVEQSKAHPNDLTVVSIGPLTNIATALAIDPTLPKRIERLVYMGLGSRVPNSDLPNELTATHKIPSPTKPILSGNKALYIHYPNQNVSADTLAAVRVFQSNMKVDVVPHVVTGQLWWGTPFDPNEPEISSSIQACSRLLEATHPPEAAVVGKLLKAWLEYRSAIFRTLVRGTCPHDPLTVSEAVYPNRFMEFTKPGSLMIHEWAGFGTFVCHPQGTHRLATTVAKEPFIDFLSQTLDPLTNEQPEPRSALSSLVERFKAWFS